jgi:SAM-dependent methyltransferase
MDMKLEDLEKREEYFLRQFENVTVPFGGLKHDDICELEALLTKNAYKINFTLNGSSNIADIGCWTGLSSSLFGFLLNQYLDTSGKVYSIDLFQGSPTSNLVFAPRYINIKNIYLDNIKQHEFAKRIELIEEDSVKAAERFKDEFFDVVFIDADHRYENARNDINAWWPKVKKYGIICGHDCEFFMKDIWTLGDRDMIEVLHIGVIRAVGEIFPNAKHTTTGSIWFNYKD